MDYTYLEQQDLPLVFETVRKYYTSQEEVPHYELETSGIQKLLGVFEKVQTGWYPTLADKTAYLFLEINKGHFFSNGNKRLALVVSTGFLARNGYRFARYALEEYQQKLREFFNSESLEEYPDFHPEEFALYNLSLIVAQSQSYSSGEFEALKQKVRDFFAFAATEFE